MSKSNQTHPIGIATSLPGCGYSNIGPTYTSASPNLTTNPPGLYNGLMYGQAIPPTHVKFDSPAYFNDDVYIKGKKLGDILDKLEERLNIVTPNPRLETEWEELRELGEKYRQLEKEILQKMAVYNELKK